MIVPRPYLISLIITIIACLSALGCGGDPSKPQIVYGEHGVIGGRFVKPRAAAIDSKDRIYFVDWTARIQVFQRDGTFLKKVWTTPDIRYGRPSGLSIDRHDHLLVSDSHYHCLRIYTANGKQLRKIGGNAGTKPGEFGYISDAVQDKDGFFYVAEFGENDRITKLDESGKFLKTWGEAGAKPGQFARIRALGLGPDGLLYVADACNHRIQVFDKNGTFVRKWGETGKEPGKLNLPYDLAFSRSEPWYVYVVEYGNHRVQKFTLAGEPKGCWGNAGRQPGQLYSPWALVVDSTNCVHVVDSENHRVQRIRF